ncbi:HlyD family efflux transporter periplasmic adaptor subunit [Rhizobium lusitanum]|nr:HlyD family efflux transporter periplasmic adaptor subunit [Rhizobium lusitanum]
MRRNRRLAVGVAIIVAMAGLGFWYRQPLQNALFGPSLAVDHITISGNIEAHQSVLSFTQVQAPIIELPFDEGARVEAGTVLARIDDRLYRQQLAIDHTNLNVAIAQVSVNQSNLSAAQHSVVSDTFDLAEKQRDFARAETLAKSDVVSQQTRDLALTAQQQSSALLAHDQALVGVAEANVRLATESVATAEARIKLDEMTLAYATLRAPFTGVVAVREAELGQLAAPGVAILTLDDLDHIWLRAYVNGPDIGKVRLGEAVDVLTDTYPAKIYKGRISFISPQAEFTPKTVETHAERITLVYRIRIEIDNPTHELLPGMPADATISLLASGQ